MIELGYDGAMISRLLEIYVSFAEYGPFYRALLDIMIKRGYD